MQRTQRHRTLMQASAGAQTKKQQIERSKRHRQPRSGPTLGLGFQKTVEAHKTERSITHRQNDRREGIPSRLLSGSQRGGANKPRRKRKDQEEAQQEESRSFCL